jgi:nucleotide-binding universal stress UspA family protein
VSATQLFVAIAVAWVAIGLATSVAMARRGHSLFSWWLLGALFGPLGVVLALDAARRVSSVRPRVRHPGAGTEGAVDVLAGVDGSEASRAAIRAAADLLGPRLRRLTLAAVVGYEAAADPREWDEEEAAGRLLDELREDLAVHDPDTVVLAGRPAEALAEQARAGGYDLLAVGARGRGASKAVLGSVASALARGRGVPVLIADA